MSDQSSKVPVTTGGAIKSFVPQSLDEAWRLAKAFHAGGIAPSSFRGPEGVLVAIIAGAAVGMDPIAAMSGIYIVNGRPQLFGDALLAVVRRSGKMTKFREWMEGSGETLTAWCELERDGGETLTRSFSWAQAKRANLAGKGGPWTQYPARMLTMRARNFALRDLFADVLSGLSNDMPEPADVGSITAHGDEAPPDPTMSSPEDVIDVEVEEMPPDPGTPVDAESSFDETASTEAENLLGELDARLRTTTTADEMEAAIEEMDVFATLEADEDSQAAAHAIITKHTKRIARL
jgi:hypothetical protein